MGEPSAVHLIAQGENAEDRWRRPLPAGIPVMLGRAAGLWSAAWDPHISRVHVELLLEGDRLRVRRLPQAANPVFFRGRAVETATVSLGECFVIGRTSFTLVRQEARITADHPDPVRRQEFSPQHLRQIVFVNPNHRLEVLSRLTQALSSAATEGEMCSRLVNLVLAGMPNAEAAAVVRVEEAKSAGSWGGETAAADASGSRSAAAIQVLQWDRRLLTAGDFRPSRRLILETWQKKQSLLHVWSGDWIRHGGGGSGSAAPSRPGEPAPSPRGEEFAVYTARQDVDWAACTPIFLEGVPHWAIYAAGGLRNDGTPPSGGAGDLREDVKFLELVASMTASLLQLRQLQRHRAVLSQFFSPLVLEGLAEGDPEELLQPREVDVTVLFCDLRGFSLESERNASQLLPLLRRVSVTLQVMTRCILHEGGVVGDFQGDAAMGFWGWPLPQEDGIARACRAALAIRREFESASQSADGSLAGFHVGIGIAHGPAVAGKIGTPDHAKVTVFGPPVNLASRLEGITKVFRVPILIDEATAEYVRRRMAPSAARTRKLAVVRPYGMERRVTVNELLPPESGDAVLKEEHLRWCDAAVDAFAEGRWEEAFELLHRLPAADPAADFLTMHIARHNRRPPPHWDGAITLDGK
ncbi:MAG: adenylate/guanylate cyclase domain-containing protein [Thermogutta sp.]|nr:adenylate/guanylate cyclase domain-containing protein [Thermogutta sp.]